MDKLVLIIDAQNDFVDGALRNEDAIKAVPNIVKFCNKAKEDKVPIWFTRDTHCENYMETSEGKNLPIPHCLLGTKGREIVNELKNFALDKVFDKPTFGSTALAVEIAGYPDLKEIYVAGFCTDICVISNVLMIKAFRPDVTIHIVKNCCAGLTPEKHEAAISVMQSCQTDIIELKDI